MAIYLVIFLISFITALILIPFIKRMSFKYNFFDDPKKDNLKIHKKPIPFLGGVAILFAFLFGLVFTWILKKNCFLDFETSKIIAIFIGGTMAWFYGFWDDTQWQQRIKKGQSAKIFIQIPIVLILALLLFLTQFYTQLTSISIISILISAFYFIFIMNAVNVQDGLDGLAGGIVLISSLGFFILFLLTNNILGLVLASILIGGIFGFLFFNWHPASIFMGNNGSYFLGFLMAVFVLMNTNFGSFTTIFAPLLILGMPIFNTGYVFSRRIFKRQRLFSADRHHFYDKLHQFFGSVPKSVLVNYFIHIIFVSLGLTILINFS